MAVLIYLALTVSICRDAVPPESAGGYWRLRQQGVTNHCAANGSGHRELHDPAPAARKSNHHADNRKSPPDSSQLTPRSKPDTLSKPEFAGSTVAIMPVPFETLLPYAIMVGVRAGNTH